MENTINLLKLLVRDNKKKEFYDLVLNLTNEAFQNISNVENDELLIYFTNLLRIIEEAMKIDDVIIILDIMENEVINYVKL